MTDFKVGDEVVTTEICGLREDIPIGSIGKICAIIHNEMYADFFEVEGDRYVGTKTALRVRKLIPRKWRQELE